MDLDYLRHHPAQLPAFLDHQRIRETPLPGGDTCSARRLTLDDGHSLFAKAWPENATTPAPDGLFAAEAAGLTWLRAAGAVPVPEVFTA
ncbi:MAG TPA: aminoglycoside phosphotransferase, partial [Pilimelia sp.]|nr:aminoglycoside phosphotransferase [Pilimelia sp.]